jgi:hypothetical protein
VYLFNTARALQLADRVDPAATLYRTYLDRPDRDPKQAERARQYLRDIAAAKIPREIGPPPITRDPSPPEPVAALQPLAEPPATAPPVAATLDVALPAPLPAAQEPVAVTNLAAPQPPPRPDRFWSTALFGTGATLAATALGLYGRAAVDRTDLDERLQQRNGAGKIAMPYADARAEADRIAARKTAAAAVGSAAAVAAGLGLYLRWQW